MSDTSRPVKTNQVDGVLQDYLDQLLISATEPAVVAEETVEETLEVSVQPQGQAATVAPVEVAIDEPIEQRAPSLDTDNTELSALDWQSAQGVECLIFKVAGLKLAIPLPLLGGVFPVTDKVTPLIGQHAWSLGVWQGEDGKLTIIDSGQLIMPERNINMRENGYSFFIQLDRSPWALACQEICDTVTLMDGSIKWRGDTSKRPWLAGTVIAEMCALIDVPGVMALLEEHRSNNRKNLFA